MKLQGKVPINEQIYCQYKEMIESGELKEGEKLPSVRTLALELGINPNTVNRAFMQLVDDKYVISLNKKGYYVNKIDIALTKEKDYSDLNNVIQKYLGEGYSIDDIINIIRKENNI